MDQKVQAYTSVFGAIYWTWDCQWAWLMTAGVWCSGSGLCAWPCQHNHCRSVDDGCLL